MAKIFSSIILGGILITSNIFGQSSPQDIVINLFVNTDSNTWEKVNKCFSENVLLDYTSFAGGEAQIHKPESIINVWKGFLPKFDATHHQVGNFQTAFSNNKAEVFCYGIAFHYKNIDSENKIWVVVGSYDFELEKLNDTWTINKMKFNYSFQYGNTDLPNILSTEE